MSYTTHVFRLDKTIPPPPCITYTTAEMTRNPTASIPTLISPATKITGYSYPQIPPPERLPAIKEETRDSPLRAPLALASAPLPSRPTLATRSLPVISIPITPSIHFALYEITGTNQVVIGGVPSSSNSLDIGSPISNPFMGEGKITIMGGVKGYTLENGQKEITIRLQIQFQQPFTVITCTVDLPSAIRSSNYFFCRECATPASHSMILATTSALEHQSDITSSDQLQQIAAELYQQAGREEIDTETIALTRRVPRFINY